MRVGESGENTPRHETAFAWWTDVEEDSADDYF